MSEVRSAITAHERLEYELTLFSRHYLAAAQHRPAQVLDRSAYLILSRLELDIALSFKEIAEAFRLDVSTVNRQVGSMLKHGLVERVVDPKGGVARKVQATEAGLAALRADREQSRQGVAKVVAEWDDHEVEQMHALITKFNRSIEALENNRWPRPSQAT
ncbi:MarR family winged helix-turn-helix transcriptional regulator [Antrihabitans cavernicola]|uniref:MarR family transcriptional regulator n=1 Tax=Antrihabitans cavernicola TaxID=2495913 RepID=A0A5A7SGW6_9NOCA|nr:MarR family transcriptional regulator [Spelaeibacter cavernicola]KAA0023957.1 MarR family transcriptional regulator [Spelaeibacter cavernicola]